MDTAIIVSHCSANIDNLMVKFRPFYVPREFTFNVVTTAHIPLDANAKLAVKILRPLANKRLCTRR